MGRKNSWLDYIDLGRQRGNSYQQFSYLFGEISEIVKKIFSSSPKNSKKKVKKSIKERMYSSAGQQDAIAGQHVLPSDEGSVGAEESSGRSGEDPGACNPSGLTIVRKKTGRNPQGVILPAKTDARGVTYQRTAGNGDTEADHRAALRNAVLWSEILGEPAAKKRHRKRVSQYYGNQGNADRG